MFVTLLLSGIEEIFIMKKKHYAIGFSIVMIAIWSSLIAMALDVSPFLSGFAADSQGRLYVGRDKRIEIFEGGKLIGEISPRTARGYTFTVLPDDTILVYTGSMQRILDLQGNELDNSNTDTFKNSEHYPASIRFKFVSSNGDIYRAHFPLGYTIICKNGKEIVYKLPVAAYIVRVLFILSFPATAFLMISYLVKFGVPKSNK